MRIWLYSCTRFLESVSSAVKHCKLQLYTIQYFLVRRIRFLFVLQSTLSSNRFSDASKRHSSVPIPILNAQRTSLSLSHTHSHARHKTHTTSIWVAVRVSVSEAECPVSVCYRSAHSHRTDSFAPVMRHDVLHS